MHVVIAFHNNGDHSIKPEVYGPFECYQDALEASRNLQYLEENTVVFPVRAKSYNKKDIDQAVQHCEAEDRLNRKLLSDYKKSQKAASSSNVPLV